ncbi:MAG: MFS transporter [Acidobacteriota bacterium]|nr:MFS transporter [Acidobacteriota bacterium]
MNPVRGVPAPAVGTRHALRTRAVVSWVLYDLANTIFTMGVVSLYFPTWLRGEVGPNRVDWVWGLISGISMAIIFVVSPLLGAMTDRARRRMPFLIASTLICVALTAVLARAGLYVSAVCFVAANVAYQAGLQFYDAMLPEVSHEGNRGKISGIGVGVGYLGSYIAVGMGLNAVFGSDDKPFLFSMIALFFLLFALPCFLFVNERGNPHPREVFSLRMLRESTRDTVRTMRSTAEYPGLLRFLVGRAFYTDATTTVINIMALYTINVAVHSGLTERDGSETASRILMTAITFAIVGGFAWGWLVDRHGPKRTLNYVLYVWMATFALAAAVGILSLPLGALYVAACGAGIALGGTFAADRPYMLRLTPPARIGEFYGLYGMVGRFSAILGPLVWAGVTGIATRVFELPPHLAEGIGVLVLLSFILISYVILQPVTDEPRDWAMGSPSPAATPARS